MQIGIYTFAETTLDPKTGYAISAAQRLRDLLEEMELADQAGLEVFGIGEHHRPDFAVSTPAVVLAAGAGQRNRFTRFEEFVKLFERRAVAGDGLNFLFDGLPAQNFSFLP